MFILYIQFVWLKLFHVFINYLVFLSDCGIKQLMVNYLFDID
jgi:hypothetical protein